MAGPARLLAHRDAARLRLLSTLASLTAGIYVAALKTARVTRAIGDLHALDIDIREFHLRNNRYPTTLTEARPLVPNDPWGRPYVYTDLSQKGSKGKARKDGKLNPINSDFDLYSVGEDGLTTTPLKPPAEQGRRHPGTRRRLPRARGRLLGAWPRSSGRSSRAASAGASRRSSPSRGWCRC